MLDSHTVRTAHLVDAEAIAEIYTESILARDSTMDTEPFSAKDIHALIRSLSPRESILVVESDEQVFGWGIVKKYSDRPGYRVACETSVYLYRHLVRQGLGRQLQFALLDFARNAGYRHVVAKIWADNASSIAFHEACGFNIVGTQREIGLVDGIRRNVTVMECLLDTKHGG